MRVVTAAQVEAFTDCLIADPSYDNSKMVNAERWCDYGDWSYKGKEQLLTIQDFYPTKEQLESLAKNGDYVMFTRQEYALKIRKAKEEAIRDFEADLAKQPKKPLSEQEQGLCDGWFELGMERSKKMFETLALKTEIRKKDTRIAELQEEVRHWRRSEEEKMEKLNKDKRKIMKKIKNEMKKPNAHGEQSISALLHKFKQEIQP